MQDAHAAVLQLHMRLLTLLTVQHTVVNARLFHFSQRVIKYWNNLSQDQVHSNSISAFKRSIESLSFNL